jgi:serine protease Do
MQTRRSYPLVVMSIAAAATMLLLSGCAGLPAISLGSPAGSTPVAAAPTAPQLQPPAIPPVPSNGAGIQATLESIYANLNPSVVNIQVVERAAQSGPVFPGVPGLGQPQNPTEEALGSGFVWDTQGDIVTNNHVIDGASKITINFSDGTALPGKVIGADPDSDLAVVKIDPSQVSLRPVTMGDSESLKVGQTAIAIGNPFGLQGTMTVGIISALERYLPVGSGNGPSYTIPEIIQTDASINPGNSGGVLLNDQGQVIGVTSAILSPVDASAGIGFAIPAAIVAKVVPALIRDGHYDHTYLGIEGTSLTPDLAKAMGLPDQQHGALVLSVVPGGPADKAGLRAGSRTIAINGQQIQIGGDVIVGIDSQPVKTFDDVVAYLALHTEVGQKVTLQVLRDGKSDSIEVQLEARPRSQSLASAAPAASQAQGARLGILGTTLTTQLASLMNLPAGTTGVLVIQVESGSPADMAGIAGGNKATSVNGRQVELGGDVITGINGKPVDSIQALQNLLGQMNPGTEVEVDILRNGQPMQISVTLG